MEPFAQYLQSLRRFEREDDRTATPAVLDIQAGESIFDIHQPANAIFGLQAGQVQLIQYLDSGYTGYQYRLHSGQWFGESALFVNSYQDCAVATRPSKILSVPKQTFLALLKQEPELAIDFTERLANQLQTAKTLMALRCLRLAIDRVYGYLRMMAEKGAESYVLDRSLKEIAEQLCLTPEVISRSLRKLQDQGLIRRDGRKVTFL